MLEAIKGNLENLPFAVVIAMDNIQGDIMAGAKIKKVKSIMLLVTLSDGCQFQMTPTNNKVKDWKLMIYSGFRLECPHGCYFEIGNPVPSK